MPHCQDAHALMPIEDMAKEGRCPSPRLSPTFGHPERVQPLLCGPFFPTWSSVVAYGTHPCRHGGGK